MSKKKTNRANLNLLVAFKGALIKKLARGMFFVVVLTTSLSMIHYQFPHFRLEMSAALPGYMGAALGLLLVFRNNTAYEKWWEARKEMGSLVNTCRNLGITINGILPHEHKEKNAIAKLVVGFAFALKEHLRDGVKMKELKDLDPEDYEKVNKADHKPNVIANIMMNRVEKLYLGKYITDIQQYLLIKEINGLVDILGKCERIRNTPIPMAYGFLLKFFIGIYVVVLPLGLLEDLGWWSIPLVMILYYILMSIVLTAEEIEEPFGKDVNDLPMEQLSITIQNNINEIVEHE
jgi:ion channel-forming bestrophin family protein